MKGFYLGLVLAAAVPANGAVLKDWHANITKDPMTDKADAQAMVITDEGAMSFLCDARNAFITVQPNRYLGGSLARYDLRDTYVRFDDEPAQMSSWKYHDKTATLYPDKATLVFMTKMQSSKRVRIRLATFDNEFVDIEFPLDNAMGAIHDAYVACAGK